MNPKESRRQFRRIAVGQEHTVRFRLLGHEFQRLPITNLSASGCFVLLSGALADRIREGLLLMDFVFEHEDLPKTPVCAQIVRVVPSLPQVTENDLGVGLYFLSTSRQFLEWVDAYVSAYYDFPAAIAG